MSSIWKKDLANFDFKYEPWLTGQDMQDLRALHAKYLECGRALNMNDVDQDPGLKSSVYYSTRFGGFRRALDLAATGAYYRNLPIGLTQESICEYLLFCLQEKAREIDRSPRVLDVKIDPKMPHYFMYMKCFFAWSRALKLAGLQRAIVMSPAFNHNSKGRWKRYSDEEILEMLYKKQCLIESELRYIDVDQDPNLPSSAYLAKRFGKWSKFLEELKVYTAKRSRV